MPEDEIQDKSRRTFLKAMIVLSAGAAVAGVLKEGLSNLVTPSVGLTSFPSLLIVDTSGKPIIADNIPVSTSVPFLFDYPLSNDPNFLLNLGKSIPSTKVSIPATGGTYNSPAGVGPNNSIVAFSAICQHLGCTPPEIHFYHPGQSVIQDLRILDTYTVHATAAHMIQTQGLELLLGQHCTLSPRLSFLTIATRH
jgi:Rieske Fe-S protein